LFRCIRGAAFCSHNPKLNFFQLCGRIRMTFAAWMNRVLTYRLPPLEMLPRIERPPVLYWRGTRTFVHRRNVVRFRTGGTVLEF
jgi:hypothetical protein